MNCGNAQGSSAERNTLRPDLARHSRLVQRLRRRYSDEFSLLSAGLPTPDSMHACLTALQARGLDTGAALRVLRQLVMERLVVLDCEQGAPLADITGAMTELAELALEIACRAAFEQLDERHGLPLTHAGARARLWIIGMGKLGARELNVSSDIDLIYVYDADGQTTGAADGSGQVSVHEYFSRASRLIHSLIGDVTEHGFVFRIDLALRPNGNSGAPVCSLPALAEYMRTQGREWERFAWMKSRVVAPRSAIEDAAAQPLRDVVLPFVFRQYLDYNVYDALRTLHQQIREHASRRSAGRPAHVGDVKISRGGIREIEFIVQLQQVVRGGQFPELRTRPTLQALQRLSQAELMPEDTAAALAAAYIFLRRVEHRVQYLDDQQTHVLPTDDDDLDWLARSLGCADAGSFLDTLGAHREAVATQFDQLLGGNKPCRHCGRAATTDDVAAQPVIDLHALAARVQDAGVRGQLLAWSQEPRLQSLRERSRQRLLQLLVRTIDWLVAGNTNAISTMRFIDWLDTVLRRESYIALLLERPSTHRRLLRVLGMARWLARYVTQHPGVIDELASPDLLTQRFDAAALENELQERRAALASTSEDNEETLLDLLRRAHHAELFRTLVRDIEDAITVEQVADDLSALADAILRVTLQWCWPLVRHRHREIPQLGLIAYGKLGGKELGYGGDLDLVFVFDDDDERAPRAYGALVRKLISWLTIKTGEGDLYEIDTELRPSGASGLLITSFDAYADYQQQRGSNTAWTWEHQAMTRARMVPPRCPAAQGSLPPEGALAALGGPGGDEIVPPRDAAVQGTLRPELSPMEQRFEAVRHAVITAPRDLAALRSEIAAMRQKIHAAHPVRAGRFDVKHSHGGMVDAEFVTQYLVLAHSREHPELLPNLGNIALLVRAEDAGLLPTGVGRRGADAYRNLRRLQHRARLDEQSTQVASETLVSERAAIEALWQAVFV